MTSEKCDSQHIDSYVNDLIVLENKYKQPPAPIDYPKSTGPTSGATGHPGRILGHWGPTGHSGKNSNYYQPSESLSNSDTSSKLCTSLNHHWSIGPSGSDGRIFYRNFFRIVANFFRMVADFLHPDEKSNFIRDLKLFFSHVRLNHLNIFIVKILSIFSIIHFYLVCINRLKKIDRLYRYLKMKQLNNGQLFHFC